MALLIKPKNDEERDNNGFTEQTTSAEERNQSKNLHQDISRVQTISAAPSFKFWIQQSYEGPILNKNDFELLEIISSSSPL